MICVMFKLRGMQGTQGYPYDASNEAGTHVTMRGLMTPTHVTMRGLITPLM